MVMVIDNYHEYSFYGTLAEARMGTGPDSVTEQSSSEMADAVWDAVFIREDEGGWRFDGCHDVGIKHAFVCETGAPSLEAFEDIDRWVTSLMDWLVRTAQKWARPSGSSKQWGVGAVRCRLRCTTALDLLRDFRPFLRDGTLRLMPLSEIWTVSMEDAVDPSSVHTRFASLRERVQAARETRPEPTIFVSERRRERG